MQPIKEVIEDGKEILENGREIIETRKEMIEDLFEKTEEYIKTNVQLIKLKAVDILAEVISSLVAKVVIGMLSFFFLLMLNIGIAIWLGQLMGQPHYGYMVVAGFYGLLTLIIFLVRGKIISKPLSNTIISQMLKIKQ